MNRPLLRLFVSSICIKSCKKSLRTSHTMYLSVDKTARLLLQMCLCIYLLTFTRFSEFKICTFTNIRVGKALNDFKAMFSNIALLLMNMTIVATLFFTYTLTSYKYFLVVLMKLRSLVHSNNK